MIQELLILNENGIALYYFHFLKKIRREIDDHQLIASFLDQIDRLTQIGLKESLHKIEWGDLIFFYFSHSNSDLRIIFKCDNSDIHNSQLMERSLGLIAKNLLNNFAVKYKDVLNNFNGEISQFSTFSENIDQIFKPR